VLATTASPALKLATAPSPCARTALGIETPMAVGPADGNVATQTSAPSALTSTFGLSSGQRWLCASRNSRICVAVAEVHSVGLPEQPMIVGSKATALGLTAWGPPQPERAKAPTAAITSVVAEHGRTSTGASSRLGRTDSQRGRRRRG